MLHSNIWSLVPLLLPGHYGWSKSTTGNSCTYPSLGEATSDQLEAGLSNGCFTSVDLVNVRFIPDSVGLTDTNIPTGLYSED